MKASRVVAAVFGTVIKVFVAVVVIAVIYQGVMFGYEYGYRVFAETPVTSGEGRSVMFTVREDMIPESEDETGLSPGSLIEAFGIGREMGKVLEEAGLIRDRNLFTIQFMFSEYRVDIKPGEYELNSSMTVDEMLERMTAGVPEETE